jgi:hypothetical protein
MNETTETEESMVLVLHEKDNTVTALEDLGKGENVFFDQNEERGEFTLMQDIPLCA